MKKTEYAQKYFRIHSPVSGVVNRANPGSREVMMQVQDIKGGLYALSGAIADLYDILSRIEKKIGR